MDSMIRIPPAACDIVVPDGTIPATEIVLGGVPRGVVIVLCESGGRERRGEDVHNGLAEHGFESVLVEFGADGSLRRPLVRPTAESLLGDLSAVVGHLAARGWDRDQIGLVGYGFGGFVTALAAATLELGAAVSLSPTGVAGPPVPGLGPLTELIDQVRTPWLGLFAEGGGTVGARTRLELEQIIGTGSSVFTHVVAYSGVTDTFYEGGPDARTHAASYDAWQRTVEWLTLRVAPRPTPLHLLWRARQTAGDRTNGR